MKQQTTDPTEMKYVIPPEAAGERLDLCLSEFLTELTRSRIQKLIKDGSILVNGSVKKTGYSVNEEDEILIHIPEPVELNIPPEDIPLDILYEDDDLLVVNKPKGMVVHPAPGHYTGTLVNALMFYCRDSLSGINGCLRPGIVHRIDRDTSGSLIICKNDMSHNEIARQLKEHSIKRLYRGICIGNVKDDEGTIHAPLCRDPKDRKKMAVNAGGKDAITHYRVLERLQGHTYLEFELETGRTHQIRVHMASIGRPLLGDLVYGPKKDPYHTNGQVLHAMTLGFIHPRTGEYIETNAPIPEYMEEVLYKLKQESSSRRNNC